MSHLTFSCGLTFLSYLYRPDCRTNLPSFSVSSGLPDEPAFLHTARASYLLSTPSAQHHLIQPDTIQTYHPNVPACFLDLELAAYTHQTLEPCPVSIDQLVDAQAFRHVMSHDQRVHHWAKLHVRTNRTVSLWLGQPSAGSVKPSKQNQR